MPEHDYSPPNLASATTHVGSYRRVLPVNLERMYENTLDWEHLPYLHDSSFSAIDCVDAGPWGWRARVTNAKGQVSELELLLERSRRRWITRNVSGPSEGAEIWTQVTPLGRHEIEIVVDFFVPNVVPEAREKVGRIYAEAYTQLYDEDVQMMVTRQRHLDQRVDNRSQGDSLDLGPVLTLADRQVHRLGGKDYVVARDPDDANQWHVWPAQCPHQLGPLQDAVLIAGVVTCPWHGYQFEVVTGNNLTGQTCRFNVMPSLQLHNERLFLVKAPSDG